jgi:hypothetical protein
VLTVARAAVLAAALLAPVLAVARAAVLAAALLAPVLAVSRAAVLAQSLPAPVLAALGLRLGLGLGLGLAGLRPPLRPGICSFAVGLITTWWENLDISPNSFSILSEQRRLF